MLSITLPSLLADLEKLTSFSAADDYGINGLQIEGAAEISKLAVAVDACVETIELAAKCKCEALLVHHGIFWKKPLPITGSTREIIKLALDADISLIAIHLPLDAHQELGNNAQIAKMLGLENLGWHFPCGGMNIGCVGSNSAGQSLSSMCAILAKESTVSAQAKVSKFDKFSTSPFYLANFGPSTPGKVAIVSGSGCDALVDCHRLGFDTFITGEPRQSAYHFCRENKLNLICMGHYASETFGVRAVGQYITSKFGLGLEFIDVPTGI